MIFSLLLFMRNFENFAPNTYYNINNSEVYLSFNGVLKWLITAPNFITSRKWTRTKLIDYLNANQIDYILAKHDKINFAQNRHAQVKDETDEKLACLELLNIKNLTQLVKLIDENKHDKTYQEIMFKGCYLNLDKGHLFFELKELINCYINNPYNATYFADVCTNNNDFKIFAKNNDITINSIDNTNIQFFELPEYIIKKEASDNIIPVDINTATSSKVEVVDSVYLAKINQVITNIDEPKHQVSNYTYREISTGIIENKEQKKLYYSVTYVLEALNKRMAQATILIGKNSVRKQIKKFLNNDPNKYQKITLPFNQIVITNNKWLAKNNRETYINEALFDALLTFYFSKNDENYPMQEPKFTAKFSLTDEFKLHSLAKQKQDQVIMLDYDGLNAIEANFNYFKNKLLSYVDEKITWLKNQTSYPFFINQTINKNLKDIESKKNDVNQLSLRAIIKEKLPTELSNINKNRHKYWATTTIPIKTIRVLDNNFYKQVNKIIDDIESCSQKILIK